MSWISRTIDKILSVNNKQQQADTNVRLEQLELSKEAINKIENHQETIRKNNELEAQIGANVLKETFDPIKESLPSKEELKEISENLAEGTNLNNGGIQDTTNESTGENSVIPIGGSFDLNALKDLQKEQWAREDEIRKETQAREDSAYQRTVEDMKKAGINPNLINVQPAASGGGITSATGIDYNGAQIEVEKYLTEIENMLDRELKADENQKDRLSDLLRGVITAAAIFFR